MSDPDGDSHMHSSSSSDEADSDAMFPPELEPPNQHNLNNLSPLLPAGSTPPHSQDFEDNMDVGASHEMVANSGGMQTRGQTTDNGPTIDFAKSPEEIHEPGAAWNNKKARDEFQRASMQVEDRGFSLKEFGDPFDKSGQDQGGQGSQGSQGNAKQ